MYRFNLILLIFLIASSKVKTYAQGKVIDSLQMVLKNAKHDTSKCSVLILLTQNEKDESIRIDYFKKVIEICERNLASNKLKKAEYNFYVDRCAAANNDIGFSHHVRGMLDEALVFYNKSLTYDEKINNKSGISNTLNNMAAIYKVQGNSFKALSLFERNYAIQKALDDKLSMSYSLNNMAMVFFDQGNIQKALDLNFQSLRIRELLNSKENIASSLNNIAGIYILQKDYANALKYNKKSLAIKEEINDKRGIVYSLINIGSVLLKQEEKQEALKYFRLSLKYCEEIQDKQRQAISLSNIGSILLGDHKYQDAINAFEKSLQLNTEVKDQRLIAASSNNLGNAIFNYAKATNNRNLYTKSLSLIKKSLKLSQELGFPLEIREASSNLVKIYKQNGNYELALKHYETYVTMRDSLNNMNTNKASVKSQLKYEYEKQAAADSVAHAKESEIKNAEIAKQTIEIKAKKNQQYALFGGLGLVVLFAGFMYSRYIITQKQKRIIENQKYEVEKNKHLVEEKQKEILDSIHYAKRIQMAQIPSEKMVGKNLERLRKF